MVITIWISARQIGQPVPILNTDDSVDTSTAETSVAARDKCVAVSLPDQTHVPHSSCLQLLPVSLLTWKSYQSLLQVMPCVYASSSSLEDSLWRGYRASVYSQTL